MAGDNNLNNDSNNDSNENSNSNNNNASTQENAQHGEATATNNTEEILILYGSETGNAESIAEGLHEDAESKGFKSTLCTLDEFRSSEADWMLDDNDEGKGSDSKSTAVPDKVKPKTVVIIASTTGNGDPPKNAGNFFRFIKKRSHPKDLLKDTQFLVLGLGDTNYDKFGHVPKIIDKRMTELGAKQLKKFECADEGTSLDAVVEPWLGSVWDVLSESCP